jgi:hypothetical protein
VTDPKSLEHGDGPAAEAQEVPRGGEADDASTDHEGAIRG